MKQIGLMLIMIVLVVSSCATTDKHTVKMTVASAKRWADGGAASMEVMLIKEGNSAKWTYFYSQIEGFNYEQGYEYVLEVKKEQKEEPIPADASSIKYILVKEISKTARTSEDMPNGIAKPDNLNN